MSMLPDETAADLPVRDITVHLSQLAAGLQDSLVHQDVRARQDMSRVSREELEDRFFNLHEENLQLKQHTHKQDDKIKKLGTKLMKLVKDRGRMEQLAFGGGQPVSRVRDVETEEMIEELQEKVRGLQMEKEGLKQRLIVAKQHVINSQRRRPTPYGSVQSRINTGLQKLRDDASSPSQTRPKSTRSLEGGGRPPTGLLPRFGHNLLEEARAKIRNLENVIELQRSQMEEMERASELQQDEMRKKEAEYEERLLQVRQQQTSKLRSHVNNNVTMIKLQKQLADRCNAVTELEGRFLQLQENQRTLKASHDAAMVKVDELSAQLKGERMKSLQLEMQLQSSNLAKRKMEQMQELISELEQERDLLKEQYDKLVNSTLDVSQQQKWQIQEQQLKFQIVQLETALKTEVIEKNETLDKIKAERDMSEKLIEENSKQKQQLEELREQLKLCSRIQQSQKNTDLSFLTEVEEGTSSVQELQAAHAETILELQKTRTLLSIESKISKDYKAELETVLEKMDRDKVAYEQKLERQAQLLDTRAAKIKKLEAQFKDVAYGTKTYVFRPDANKEDDEDEEDEFSETLHLQRGENLLELQIIGATLSPSALEVLADSEPSTFCTYAFYLFELHSTPVVTGQKPKYGFTSKYIVSMDDNFLHYLHSSAITVELHQALGLDWRTLARGRLQLHQLLEQDGKVHGTLPLVGTSDEACSFGSVDYWLRMRIPMAEAIHLFRQRVKATGYVHTGLNKEDTQPPCSSSWNELSVTVQSCRALRSRHSKEPSPYVVYKIYEFPDYPTATIDNCCDPHFNDVKSYRVSMDEDLDQYLKSEVLQLYVFDYKEEKMDEYLGKAIVPLLPLSRDEGIAGAFKLTDHYGLPAGHIEVKLKWKFVYFPPSGSIRTAEEPKLLPKEEDRKLKEDNESKQEEKKDRDDNETLQEDATQPSISAPQVTASKAPLPKPRHSTQVKEGQAAKRVTFVDPTATETRRQVEDRSSAGVSAGRRQTLSPVVQFVSTPAAQNTEEEEEDEEEESQISEGQLLSVGSQSSPSNSEISEEIMEDVEQLPATKQDQSESTQSDSDDCIVHGQTTGRKTSERIRVEILSLSLRPECQVARDSSVVRLFVEYSLLDLPTEETPLSLPKPPRGKSINYNYSKVFPVDAVTNGPRRRLLRDILQGRNPQMERIRFTVVSEPPEEEEQEKECEDVGVAFLRIPEILEKQQDLTETSLTVMDMEDSGEVVGSLMVSVEGLEALRSIMEDEERCPAPLLLPSA